MPVDRVLAGVFEGKMQHRRWQTGIRRIEGDEGRERFQLHLDRKSFRLIFDRGDRIFAAKNDIGKADSVQRTLLGLTIRLNMEGEALIDRRLRLGWVGIVVVAGADDLIENVPMPQLAVAAEINLAGAEAADRHSDQRRLGAVIDVRRSARGQRFHPFRRQLLVERNELFGVLGGKGTGDEIRFDDERERADAKKS